jgi:hypothetical protein
MTSTPPLLTNLLVLRKLGCKCSQRSVEQDFVEMSVELIMLEKVAGLAEIVSMRCQRKNSLREENVLKENPFPPLSGKGQGKGR